MFFIEASDWSDDFILLNTLIGLCINTSKYIIVLLIQEHISSI
jgi:hypothetical protein